MQRRVPEPPPRDAGNAVHGVEAPVLGSAGIERRLHLILEPQVGCKPHTSPAGDADLVREGLEMRRRPRDGEHGTSLRGDRACRGRGHARGARDEHRPAGEPR